MAHLNIQAVFLLFLLKIVSECRGSTDTETVLASKDEDVALLCLNSNVTDLKSHRVRWIKYATAEHSEKVIFEGPKKSQGDERVTVEVNENGQFHLSLKTLQKSDAGFYSCEIWERWERVHVKNISLKVKDCRALEAVKAAPKTFVQLNCQVNIPSEVQTPVNISWAVLKGNTPVPVDSEKVKMNGTFLTFPSVTTSDSGWYRCTLGQTQQCSEIKLCVAENACVATTVPVTAVPTSQQALTVTERMQINKKEPSSGTLIPVVVLVVIGILILVASAGFFMYRRYKTQKEMQQQPRQPADSFDAYENLTLPRLQGGRKDEYCQQVLYQTSCFVHHFTENLLLPADSGNRVNSLYRLQEENLCTCKYYFLLKNKIMSFMIKLH
ncbi:uncharacterized protein LOC121642391 isoform X2 [Melanotaenia boesemani]|uniref:uncharacterized protein LOC121642391 isoform X2 n=1 Tax=Melanotaenia boesemani TaxID=1250792 RepID=UPI001C057674|nr:uncharacterized protein LOC121642391 isoform X2 [Melanotaenia boesemani]